MGSELEKYLPNLDQPLSTEERARIIASLIAADAELALLASCVDRPASDWPEDIANRLRTSGVPGDMSELLRRWWMLFADETRLVREIRDQVVHQARVSDGDVRRAEWIARELLRIALGQPGEPR